MMNRFGDIDFSFKRLPPVYGYRSAKVVSLEKALEPIVSQIDELPYYIKVAKKYCHYPSEHGLSKDQSAAVYIYTMEFGDTSLYRVLNKTLRSENRQALKIWFPYLKLFDTALDLLPTVKEVVWRGVPLDIGKNFTKNQLVTWWSISSCSLSVNVIENFLENDKNSTLFLIEAISGKKVSGYTEYANENEVILRMGTQFHVNSNPLNQSNAGHIVHLIEIDDNNDQPLASTMNEMHLAIKSSNKGASASSSKKNLICPRCHRHDRVRVVHIDLNRDVASDLIRELGDLLRAIAGIDHYRDLAAAAAYDIDAAVADVMSRGERDYNIVIGGRSGFCFFQQNDDDYICLYIH